jgi:enoyl-CoA hydratase
VNLVASTAIKYQLDNGVATIQLDDGKRNALSPRMFKEINAALDQAEADQAIVILTGREEVFSAGFDLKVMKAGGPNALRMLSAGYSLTARVLAYPYPVITACNGHVLAMGVFLMLASDYVVASRGDFKVSANEVALGLTMPRVGAAMLGHRLTPAAYQRAVCLSEYFPVEAARSAGFFDELVEPAQLMSRAQALAQSFAQLDMPAHAASKHRIRASLIKHIRRSVPLDVFDAVKMGLRGARPRSSV